jgi:NADH:ubiquinone oxidoreductase subunit E
VNAFTFTGEFAGFVRLADGKRRLLLRTHEQELLFKLAKEMRQELDGMLAPGASVTVKGIEEDDGEHRRLVVSELHIDPEHQRGHCTVRVCSKKNCWRAGGRELAHLLEKEIDEAGLSDVVRLKITGCLDRCDDAPTVACNEHHIAPCTPHAAQELVARLKARLKAPTGARH